MSYESLFNSYSELRSEDAGQMRSLLAGLPDTDHLLSHVFWANAHIDPAGKLQTFYAPLPAGKKFNAVTFDPADTPAAIERDGDFWKLRVSSHRVLDLGSFSDEESFFRALSPKNRKKLRWLRNAVPKLGCQVVPLESAADFAKFEQLYCAQFSKYTPDCADNQAVWRIYQEFIRQKRSFSFLLLSADGEPLAAALGYFNGTAYNYTHLTRSIGGEFDKYSPGYYLTFCIVMKLLADHPELKYFFMGPGEYDYKRAFLGEPFAIYRYERRKWWNLAGYIRLKHRLHKELAAAKLR